MSVEEGSKVDKLINVDLFLYIYAVAAKKRPDDLDDNEFMAQLYDSLVAFKKKKAEGAVRVSLAFDTDAPSSSGRKEEKREKDPKNKVFIIQNRNPILIYSLNIS